MKFTAGIIAYAAFVVAALCWLIYSATHGIDGMLAGIGLAVAVGFAFMAWSIGEGS